MPRTPLARNLVYNGDFNSIPTFVAPTTGGAKWIDGTAGGSDALWAYGWAILSGAISNADATLVTDVKRNGLGSLRMRHLTTAGTITCGSYKVLTSQNLYVLEGSTSYTLTGYMKTNNVPTNGAFLDLREYSTALATLATVPTSKLTGTNTEWTPITLVFTTNASTRLASILPRMNVTGNICESWLADVQLRKTSEVLRTVV